MINSIKKFKKYSIYHFLACLSVVFFVLYSYLAFVSPSQYNSPDEQSNYFFVQQFVEHRLLTYHEPANAIVKNLVHPRSTGVIGENIVPGGFLGLIFYFGCIGFLLGMWIIPFIIPFISAITPLALFYIIRRLFNDAVALLASFLLFVHPAYWYFSSRSLFPNILLLNILMWSGVGIIYAKEVKNRFVRFLLLAVSGISVGIALSIRLNEIIWIIPFILLIFIFWKPRFLLKEYFLFFSGIVLGILPVLGLNYVVYGSPIFTGYFEVNTMISAAGESVTSFKDTVLFIVLPFGFHIKNIIKNLVNYQLRIFSYITPLIFLFLVFTLVYWKKMTITLKKYLIVYIAIIFILGIYYGSWKFHDHPDPRAISIGTSYIRYWLPLYVMSLPLISYMLITVADRINQFFLKKYHKDIKVYSLYAIIVICVYLFWNSFQIVYITTDESLYNVRNSIITGLSSVDIVTFVTPENAIVYVDYDDKYLFPDRSVVVPFRNEYNLHSILHLMNYYPIYYFGLTLPQKDMDYIHSHMFGVWGINMKPFIHIGNKTLYQFEWTGENMSSYEL